MQPSASTFDSQDTISHFKSTFVSEMWGALCGLVKNISMGSLDRLENLEEIIALTLEEIRKVNIIDISTIEGPVENFSKAYAEYNVLIWLKMTSRVSF